MPRVSKTGVRGLRKLGDRYQIDLRWRDATTGERKRHTELLPLGASLAAAKLRTRTILNAALVGAFNPRRAKQSESASRNGDSMDDEKEALLIQQIAKQNRIRDDARKKMIERLRAADHKINTHRCGAINRNGGVCERPCIPNRNWCYLHSPEMRAKGVEGGKRSGAARRLKAQAKRAAEQEKEKVLGVQEIADNLINSIMDALVIVGESIKSLHDKVDALSAQTEPIDQKINAVIELWPFHDGVWVTAKELHDFGAHNNEWKCALDALFTSRSPFDIAHLSNKLSAASDRTFDGYYIGVNPAINTFPTKFARLERESNES